MRLSRVLVAGAAVAAAGIATSAFTNSNTFTPGGGAADTDVGYGQLSVTGVTVSNVAYAAKAANAALLDKVTFTVGADPTDTTALLTLTAADDTRLGGAALPCDSTGGGTPNTIICTVGATDVEIEDITKVALTVTSK